MRRRKFKYHDEHYSTKALIGFNDFWLGLIGVLVLGFFIPVIFFKLSVIEAWNCFFQKGLPSIFITAIFWVGDRKIIVYFRRIFPDHRDLPKRLIKQTLAIVLFTIVVCFGLTFLGQYADRYELKFVNMSFSQTFIASFVSAILVSSIYEAAYFFFRWKESLAEAEVLKKERVSSQLEALRNQVNPHFLFNSLNTLASIIPEDPKKSVEFVQKMSAVYRKLLDMNEKQVVTLGEELRTLEEYLFLVKTRFPENLYVQFEIEESAKSMYVVPMSLQNLVENAIKHNVVSKKKPLIISIRSNADEVIVENEVQKKNTEERSTKTGLSNIDKRNRLTFGRRLWVEETEDRFIVRLPLEKIEEK